MNEISLKFQDNGTLHEDLIFIFKDDIKKCDSYYFALDRNIDPENEDSEKIKKVLRKLLEQWSEYVTNSKSNNILLLPYDFSDQYIGCLRCEIKHSSVLLTNGYSTHDGWSCFPGDITDFVKEISSFIVTDKNRLEITTADFLQCLKEEIDSV